MATNKKKQFQLTLKRSLIGAHEKHKACISGLGIRRMHHTVVVDDTPCNRGMINKVNYLLLVKEI